MKPIASKEQCERLAFLLNDGQWHRGRTLGMNGRMIRAACAEQPSRFMSSQQGYKLVKYSTQDEIAISLRDLLSRCRCLNDRAEGLQYAMEHGGYLREVQRQGQLL